MRSGTAWRDLLRSEAIGLPGVVTLDLDEKNNRLVVGVEDAAIISQVRRIGRVLDIPRRALAVVQASRLTPLDHTVRDRVRPALGGLEIHNGNGECTLGFSARSDFFIDGAFGFVTASHCTTDLGGVQNTQFWQQDPFNANDLLGTESLDPTPFSGGTCPDGLTCRNADAAFVTYDAGVVYDFGRLVRSPSWDHVSGPLDIVHGDQLSIVADGTFDPAAVGELIFKVGRTTGGTWGNVVRTCLDAFSGRSGVWILCSTETNGGRDPETVAHQFSTALVPAPKT
ncbi:MAG: hypothetical protein ACE5F5_13015 [Acidimicrobiia bacterium]